MKNSDFHLSPVGSVRVGTEGFVIAIDPPYRSALVGLEGFSHVNVLWWANLVDEPAYRAITQCDEPYRGAPSPLGIFATRSPMRPNPICLSAAQLIHVDVEQGLLHLAYIDTEDGTPILDIKAYHPSADRVRDLSVPAWCAHWPQWYEDSGEFDWAAEFISAR